jgi:hypothetical protein
LGIDESRGVYFSESRGGVELEALGLGVEGIVGGNLLRAVIVVGFVHKMLKMMKQSY